MNKLKKIVFVLAAVVVFLGATSEVQAATVVFSGSESQLMSQYGTVIHQDMLQNGGVYQGNAGIYAGGNVRTLDRICDLISPGSQVTNYGRDDYTSPGNNSIVLWNGTSWEKHGARNYNNHLRGNITCTSYAPPAPVNYGAYCGDGFVNQTWEQCDGGNSCTNQCQDSTSNQCVDLILARVNITNVNNETFTIDPEPQYGGGGGYGGSGGGGGSGGPYYNIYKAIVKTVHAVVFGGNMTSDIFVGNALNVMPQGTWFPLYYNGSYYNDPSIGGYENVPGLAVQRTQGRITTLMHGGHTNGGVEHVEGNIEVWNANITTQTNSTGNNVFEQPTNGNMEVNPFRDEYWKSGGKSYFWSTVTAQDDAFHTNYSATTPICIAGPPVQPTATLDANPTTITQGSPSVLSWSSTNTTSCTGTNFNTANATSGSVTVYPSSTTTYNVSCTGPGGSDTDLATIGVLPNPQGPTCDLDLSAEQISWGTTLATSVVINPLTNSPQVPGAYGGPYGPGVVVFSGSESQLMSQYGTVIHQDMLQNGGVYQGTAGIYGGQGGSSLDRICELIDPYASATSFGHDDYSSPGNNTIVKWNGSSWSKHGASGYNNHLRGNLTCTSYAPVSPYPLSGLHNFIPTLTPGTHTYELTATGPTGTAICEETVVVPYPPLTLAFTADPENINAGDPVTVEWDSENTTSCVGTNFDTSGATSGSVTVYPSDDTTYEIECTGPSGDISDNDTVYVTPNPTSPTADLDLDPTSNIDPGDDVELTWSSTNATTCVGTNFTTGGATSGAITVYPFSDTTYSVECTGPGGIATDSDTALVNSITPTADLMGDPTTINIGESTELTWSSTNTTICESADFTTGNTTSGTVTVSPTVTTDYEVSCSGPHGIVDDLVTITVNTGGGGNAPTCTLTADPHNIVHGGDTELVWTSTNATSATIDNGVGSISPIDSGDVDISPNNTTTYTATFTGPGGTTTCSQEITVDSNPVCTNNCGGGGGPPFDPHISLAINDNPGEQPLAFVYLSQIPYTGFGAGPIVTTLFWLIILGISIFLGHIIISKGVMQKFVAHMTQQGATIYAHNNVQDNNMNFTAADNIDDEMDDSPVAAPDLAGLSGKLEARAHEENILVSSEGLNIVVGLGGGTEHGAFDILETLIAKAKDTYPREDGWILLNTKRVHNLLPHTTAPAVSEEIDEEEEDNVEDNKVQAPTEDDASEESVTDDSVVIEFIKNIIVKDMNKTFEILRGVKDITPPEFIAQVVVILDEVYKDRLEGYRNKNEEVSKLLSDWTDDSLEGVIEILAEAIDHSYTSNRIGVKVALTKMFKFLG